MKSDMLMPAARHGFPWTPSTISMIRTILDTDATGLIPGLDSGHGLAIVYLQEADCFKEATSCNDKF